MNSNLYKKYIRENAKPTAAGDIGSDDYRIMDQVVRMETDTVYEYIKFTEQAKNPKLKKVLADITQEERIHAEEMRILMKQLQSEIGASAYTEAEKENKELDENTKLLKKYLK